VSQLGFCALISSPSVVQPTSIVIIIIISLSRRASPSQGSCLVRVAILISLAGIGCRRLVVDLRLLRNTSGLSISSGPHLLLLVHFFMEIDLIFESRLHVRVLVGAVQKSCRFRWIHKMLSVSRMSASGLRP